MENRCSKVLNVSSGDKQLTSSRPIMPVWNGKEMTPSNTFLMMEAAEPLILGSAIRSDNLCAVISGTVKCDTEPQYVKNPQTFLKAAAELRFGGGEKTAQKM